MDSSGVPDIYVDFVQVATGDLGVFLGLHAASPLHPSSLDTDDREGQFLGNTTELKAKVRFSLGGAKVFAIILSRALREYEEQQGEIPVLPGFPEQANVSKDEWLND